MFNRKPEDRRISDEQLEKISRCGCAGRAVRKLMAKELLEHRQRHREQGKP